MRIGTTPTYTFRLPFSASTVQKAKVTFSQNRTVVLEKKDDFIFEEDTIKVSLTQVDTFLFDSNYRTEVQLRVVTISGAALSTDIYTLEVEECLDNEVL